MNAGRLRGVVCELRRATAEPGPGLSDAELLRRYTAGGDEAAFELLVWRHAAMVLGVCRRVLRHAQDAEDAFQATWLLLARRARSVGRRESVGGWLHTVAYRVALRARARAEGRLGRERPMVEPAADPGATDPGALAAWRELGRVLDEQIDRLPQRYRSALVLRCLAGMSGAEAARELGCAEGTVESRLARARARLREALERRGFVAPAALLAAGVSLDALAERVSAAQVAAAVRAATAFVARQAAVPAGAAILAEGVLRTMLMTRIKLTTAAAVLAVALLGVGLLRFPAEAGEDGGSPKPEKVAPVAQKPAAKPVARDLDGTWKLEAAEVGGKTNPDLGWLKGELYWVIGGDTLTIRRWGQNSSGTFKLDAGQAPGKFDLTLFEGPVPAGRTYAGIFKREGDRMVVCFATDGGERPTAFATKPGSSTMLAGFVRADGSAAATNYFQENQQPGAFDQYFGKTKYQVLPKNPFAQPTVELPPKSPYGPPAKESPINPYDPRPKPESPYGPPGKELPINQYDPRPKPEVPAEKTKDGSEEKPQALTPQEAIEETLRDKNPKKLLAVEFGVGSAGIATGLTWDDMPRPLLLVWDGRFDDGSRIYAVVSGKALVHLQASGDPEGDFCKRFEGKRIRAIGWLQAEGGPPPAPRTYYLIVDDPARLKIVK
jgi:RNA polymerase sigma factor (sigma-70 family)